jgi:hypothetical protein
MISDADRSAGWPLDMRAELHEWLFARQSHAQGTIDPRHAALPALD